MALGTIVGDLGLFLFFLSFFSFSGFFFLFSFSTIEIGVRAFYRDWAWSSFSFTVFRRCLQLPYSIHMLRFTLQCHNQ